MLGELTTAQLVTMVVGSGGVLGAVLAVLASWRASVSARRSSAVAAESVQEVKRVLAEIRAGANATAQAENQRVSIQMGAGQAGNGCSSAGPHSERLAVLASDMVDVKQGTRGIAAGTAGIALDMAEVKQNSKEQKELLRALVDQGERLTKATETMAGTMTATKARLDETHNVVIALAEEELATGQALRQQKKHRGEPRSAAIREHLGLPPLDESSESGAESLQPAAAGGRHR